MKPNTLFFIFTLFAFSTFVFAEKSVLPTKASAEAEAFSPYGNPVRYRVKGKLYQVLRSAKGYVKEGVASWYGTRFHKKKTSSGEPYNMYALTAAHKTLPLPSYVKVRNLENGKEIIVRVNDRGPFHSNRVIDLSYAAARKLGMSLQGLAKVRIEALTPDVHEDDLTADYYIQVAAYKGKSLAKRLQKKLESSTKHPVSVSEKSNHYVVMVGPLFNAAVLAAVKIELQRLGYRNPIVSLR